MTHQPPVPAVPYRSIGTARRSDVCVHGSFLDCGVRIVVVSSGTAVNFEWRNYASDEIRRRKSIITIRRPCVETINLECGALAANMCLGAGFSGGLRAAL